MEALLELLEIAVLIKPIHVLTHLNHQVHSGRLAIKVEFSMV